MMTQADIKVFSRAKLGEPDLEVVLAKYVGKKVGAIVSYVLHDGSRSDTQLELLQALLDSDDPFHIDSRNSFKGSDTKVRLYSLMGLDVDSNPIQVSIRASHFPTDLALRGEEMEHLKLESCEIANSSFPKPSEKFEISAADLAAAFEAVRSGEEVAPKIAERIRNLNIKMRTTNPA